MGCGNSKNSLVINKTKDRLNKRVIQRSKSGFVAFLEAHRQFGLFLGCHSMASILYGVMVVHPSHQQRRLHTNEHRGVGVENFLPLQYRYVMRLRPTLHFTLTQNRQCVTVIKYPYICANLKYNALLLQPRSLWFWRLFLFLPTPLLLPKLLSRLQKR